MKYRKILSYILVIVLFCPYFYVYGADKDDDKKGTNNSSKNMYEGLKDVTYQDEGVVKVDEETATGKEAENKRKTYATWSTYMTPNFRKDPFIDKNKDAYIDRYKPTDQYEESDILRGINKLGLTPDKNGTVTAYLNNTIRVQWNNFERIKWCYNALEAWNTMKGNGKKSDPDITEGVAQGLGKPLAGTYDGFVQERYNIKIERTIQTYTFKIQQVLDDGKPKQTFQSNLYANSSFRIEKPDETIPAYVTVGKTKYQLQKINVFKSHSGTSTDYKFTFKSENDSEKLDLEKLKEFRGRLFNTKKNMVFTLYYIKVKTTPEQVPVTVELRCLTKRSPEEYKVVSPETEQGKYDAGSKTTLKTTFVKNSVTYKNNTYTPERAVIQSKESGNVVKRANFRNGTTTIAAFRGAQHSVGRKGIKVIVYYSRTDTTASPPGGVDPPSGGSNVTTSGNTETVNFLTPVGVQGVIGADIRGQEQFDVTKGIPVTENLYTCVQGQRYLVSYSVTKHSGTTTHVRNWTTPIISGTDKKGNPIIVNVPHSATDTRSYTYYTISNVKLYAISRAEITNDAFSIGTVILQPKNYQEPRITVNSTGGVKAYPIGSNTPTPYTQYEVANDTLVIDGTVILASEEVAKRSHTSVPSHISCPSAIDNNVLFEQGLTIPVEKENGYRESKGVLVYRRLYGSGSEELKFPININEVVIHTPTVCYPSVSNEKKWNQMITPDKSKPSFVLDRTFSVTMPTTGSHRAIKGYGNRDYKKYIKERQVRFPFDVYKNGENGTYVKANTWITVGTGTTNYYLPSWVKEGYHKVEFRSIAVNTKNNFQVNQVEENSNKNLEHYVATKTISVQVSGRVFGFAVYDISDYPLWESVFRKSNTTKLTGIKYRVGTKTRNGEPHHLSDKLVLPLLPGSHPTKSCQGAIPLGYVTRFSMYTIGNMTGKKDSIRIKPRFYYMTRDGKIEEEVDLWYNETFQGKYHTLVKVGSQEDKKNQKILKIGSLYSGASKEEIHNTEKILGMGKYKLYDEKVPVYTFGIIEIPWQMRTFIGKKNNCPKNISEERVSISVQKWYGEYSLPATLYAVKKDFNIWDWVKKYGKNYGGINFSEPFWKSKNGYILVNFEIETIHEGQPYLSYINLKNTKEGYCNMWNMEGYQYKQKNCMGKEMNFKNGDYALFDLKRSVKDDYVSGGTH